MTFGTCRYRAGGYNRNITLLKRNYWFFAAAGICSLIAAGLPLLIQLLTRSQPAYATPRWLEIGAFVVFGLAFSTAMLDKSRAAWHLWVLLCVQSASMLLMAVHGTTIVIFPL